MASEEDLHGAFCDDGYVIVRGAVPRELAAAAADRLENSGCDDAAGTVPDELQACMTDRLWDEVDRLFGDGHRVVRHRAVTDLPREPTPRRRPGTTPEPLTPLHIDDDAPTLLPGSFAMFGFVFLTDVTAGGGGLLVSPGSHRQMQVALRAGYRGPVYGEATPLLTRYLGGTWPLAPLQEVLVDAGDVILCHHLLCHTGSRNTATRRTRHALLFRVRPSGPIRADRGNDASPIEHALSSELARDVISGGRTIEAVDGKPCFSAREPLQAHCVVRDRDELIIFFVGETTPDTLWTARSKDGSSWVEQAVWRAQAPIVAINLLQQLSGVVLSVDTGSETMLLWSQDLRTWRSVGNVQAARSCPSSVRLRNGPAGNVLYYVPRSRPDRIRWTCSGIGKTPFEEQWHNVASWHDEGEAGSVVAGISDITIDRIDATSALGVICDVGTSRSTRPWAARTMLPGAVESFVQLRVQEGEPFGIRCWARGPDAWLVTFLDRAASNAIHWGLLHWADPPALEPVIDQRSWERALSMVGLRCGSSE